MIELLIYMQPWSMHIQFLMLERRGESTSVAGPITMRTVEPEELAREDTPPSFSLRMDAAQQLMDGLWKCGLRPSEGSGSAGALRATEAHLADMQKIVWEILPRTYEPLRIVDMADPNAPTIYPHQGPIRKK